MRATLLLVLLLAGCARSQIAATPLPRMGPQRWTAVLVAGDKSLPVFDNATGAMATLLERAGVPPEDIHRFSASPSVLATPHVQVATRARVLDAVAELHPAPGQACLVFITSHGAHGEGVYLATREEFLLPADLDTALQSGCGSAPTVAIVSACYTGGFAQSPVAKANRIVLTASAADRPSFGCGAGRELTYYDQCILGSLNKVMPGWSDVATETDKCVSRLEALEHVAPSDPQSWIGRSVAGLPVAGG
ncbi:C13 family peptidase [Acidisphaera sp. L21]|uniref:C13 family peptidase n=1 Tax=Acidisphaera sp. L21 TaxID=1641851 RepID=UPI00131B3260|nr:C13 family peptidase [Acidisphaera sp. L21]